MALAFPKWYLQLNNVERQQLKEKLHKSPLALTLLDLIEQAGGRAPGDKELIRKLFPDEWETTDYRKLQVRYLNLCNRTRKLLTDIVEVLGDVTAIEKQLLVAQRLQDANQMADLFVLLSDLEKRCLHHNLLHHLLRVHQLRMYSYSINDLFIEYQAQLEEYNAVVRANHDLIDMNRLFLEAQNIRFKYNYEACRPVLEQMKILARRNPRFIRFELHYLFACVKFGFGPKGRGNHPAALSRHMNRLNDLIQANPEVCITNEEPGIRVRNNATRLYLLMMHSLYAFDFEQARVYNDQIWDFKRRNLSTFGSLSYSDMQFRIGILRRAGAAQEALALAEEFVRTESKNKDSANYYRAIVELANVTVFAYPQYKTDNYTTLVYKVEKTVQFFMEQGADVMAGRVQLFLLMLHLQYGQYRRARQLVRQQALPLTTYLTQLDLRLVMLKATLLPLMNREQQDRLYQQVHELFLHEKDLLSGRYVQLHLMHRWMEHLYRTSGSPR